LWASAVRRGEISRSAEVLGRLDALASATGYSRFAGAAWVAKAWTSLLTERPLPPRPGLHPPGVPLDPMGLTLVASLVGDTAGGARAFAKLRPNLPIVGREPAWQLVLGVAEVRGGDVRAGLQRLAGPARGGYSGGSPGIENVRMLSRWIAADAFQRDSPD